MFRKRNICSGNDDSWKLVKGDLLPQAKTSVSLCSCYFCHCLWKKNHKINIASQAWIAPAYPYITYLLHSVVFQLYLGTCVHTILVWACALFVYLFNWRVHLVRLLMSQFYFALFSSLIHCPWLCSHGGWLLLKCSAIGIGFNGVETNCGIARILGILLMNSCDM